MPQNMNYPYSGSQKVSPIWSTYHALLDEGSLFSVASINAASGKAGGTAIATTTSVVDDAATASATHAQNVPVMFINNPGASGDVNSKTIYPLFLPMSIVQVPTSATVWNFAIRCDNTARYTSGGTLLAPQNLSMGSQNASIAQIYFGAVVTALPGANQRVVGSGMVQATIPVTKDNWIFTFGDITANTNVLTASAGKNLTIPCAPFAISAGWNCAIEMWGASNAAAPSWEFEFVYAERFAGL